MSTEISSGGIHRKFAEPKTDAEVSQARESAIPAKTRQDTAYCVRMWDEWASFRNGRPGTSTSYIPSLIQLANDPPKLQYWLSFSVWKQGRRMGLNSHRIHFIA